MPKIPEEFEVYFEMKTSKIKTERLMRFVAKMTPLDIENFKCLLNLPNPEEIIKKCPNKEYRENALYALEVRRLVEKNKEKFGHGKKGI